MVPTLRTITEVVAAADHLSLACQSSFETVQFEEDGERDAAELFARNGLGAAQHQALIDRTRSQLERSRVFLSLLSGS